MGFRNASLGIRPGDLAAAIAAENALDDQVITGSTFRTSAAGNRLELTNLDELRIFSGLAGEVAPGKLFGEFFSAGTALETGSVYVSSPKFADLIGAFLRVRSSNADRTIDPSIDLSAFDGTITATADSIAFTDSGGFTLLTLRKTGGPVLPPGAWRPAVLPLVGAGGVETVTAAGGGVITSKTVTFPAGRFATAPNVTVSPVTARPDLNIASVMNVTATDFDIRVYRNAGAAADVDVQWVARANL